jgi:Lrp/AsnC family transcriptional regulator, leucine-responsive regulatory protein
MKKSTQSFVLDDVDKAILYALQDDGRLSNVELGRKINLSPPATHTRLKRLKEAGYIQKYSAILDREMAGYDLLCFIHIGLQMPQAKLIEKFRKATSRMPEVMECHHITGDYDYLLKVVLKNHKDLQQFVIDKITPIPGVARIYTSLVLLEVKSTTALSLE